MKSLVIVVNYNQIKEIGPLLDRLPNYHSKSDILVVDDGSSDGSREAAENRGYEVITHTTNRGVGAAIRTGIETARSRAYDYVVIMASNGKMLPEDLPLVKQPIEQEGADYVAGSRFINGGSSPGLPLFRRIAIPIVSFVTSFLLRRRFSDVTCGYRAYKLNWLNNKRINLSQEWLDRYELEYYIQYWACQLKIKIAEVPVQFTYSHLEKGRKSKISPFVGWWSMVRPFLYLSLRIRR